MNMVPGDFDDSLGGRDGLTLGALGLVPRPSGPAYGPKDRVVPPFRKTEAETQAEFDEFREAEIRYRLGLPYGLNREPDAKGRGSCKHSDCLLVPTGNPSDNLAIAVEKPCERCRDCYIRRLYAETVNIMRDMWACDHVACLTFTYADPEPMPDDGDFLGSMVRGFKLAVTHRRADWALPAGLRFAQEHASQRAQREYDLAHQVCKVGHLRKSLDKLRSQGKAQGMVTVLDEQGQPVYDTVTRTKPGKVLRDAAGLVLRGPDGRAVRGPERVITERKLRKVFDPSRGFKLRVFAAYERSAAGRSHYHAVVGIIGAKPDGWRDLADRNDQRQWISAWPHGHVHIGWEFGEGAARYLVKYLLKQVLAFKGRPRGPHADTEKARAFAQYDQAGNLDLKATAAVRWQAEAFGELPGFYRRPSGAGHAFARAEAVRHARLGIPAVDAILPTPGMRNQTDEWVKRDGKTVRVHKGRAVPLAGSARSEYLLTFAAETGVPVSALAELYDRRPGRFGMAQSLRRAERVAADRQARLDRRNRIAEGKALGRSPLEPPAARFERSSWGQVAGQADPARDLVLVSESGPARERELNEMARDFGLDGLSVLLSIFESERLSEATEESEATEGPEVLEVILSAAELELEALTDALRAKYAARRKSALSSSAAPVGEAGAASDPASSSMLWDGLRYRAADRPSDDQQPVQPVPWFKKPGDGWWRDRPDFGAVVQGPWMEWPQAPP